MGEVKVIVAEPRNVEYEATISKASTFNDLSTLRVMKVASGDLVAGLVSTRAFAWQNPEPRQIVVYEVIINITTQAGAAAALAVGVVANADATANTIFNGLLLNAVKCVTSHEAAGVGVGNNLPHIMDENGGANDWITGWENGSAAMTDMVAKYYIFYTEV